MYDLTPVDERAGRAAPLNVEACPPTSRALIQRQLERDRLRELIEDAETEHRPVDQEAVEAKRALLRGDAAGPHGHRYALDAIVAATAPASPSP